MAEAQQFRAAVKHLLLILMVGTAFWLGVASQIGRQPPIVTRVIVQPANEVIWKNENCIEVARACYGRKRSAKVGK